MALTFANSLGKSFWSIHKSKNWIFSDVFLHLEEDSSPLSVHLLEDYLHNCIILIPERMWRIFRRIGKVWFETGLLGSLEAHQLFGWSLFEKIFNNYNLNKNYISHHSCPRQANWRNTKSSGYIKNTKRWVSIQSTNIYTKYKMVSLNTKYIQKCWADLEM